MILKYIQLSKLKTPLGKMAGIALKGQCDLGSIMVRWRRRGSFKKAYFCERTKAIALLFGEEEALSKRAYFFEQTKAIALLFFGKKRLFEKGTIFAKKTKAIALRFGKN